MVELELTYFEKHFEEVIKRVELGETITLTKEQKPLVVLLPWADYEAKIKLLAAYQKRFPDYFTQDNQQFF